MCNYIWIMESNNQIIELFFECVITMYLWCSLLSFLFYFIFQMKREIIYLSIPNLISMLLFTFAWLFWKFWLLHMYGGWIFFLIKKKKKKKDFMLPMFFNKLTRTPHSSGFSICYRVIFVRKLGHFNREI